MAKKKDSEVKPATKPATKKKARRKPHATRPTATEKLIIGERRQLVVELAVNGASIRQIANQIKAKGYVRCSPATVHADLNAALSELADLRVEKTESLVELELIKLDKWELNLNLELQKTENSWLDIDKKLNIYNILVRLQNQRDKFLALSKREKSKNDARATLAKLMGVDPDKLPEPTK